MKKSQILAALALAFALGVVAPISATTTYAADDQANTCTGTSEDLANAIKNVTTNPTYVAYEALAKAKADADTTVGVLPAMTVSYVKGQLITQIAARGGRSTATTDTIKDLLTNAKNNTKINLNGEDRSFTQMQAFINAMMDTTPSDEDEIAAIKSTLNGLGYNGDTIVTSTTPGTVTVSIVTSATAGSARAQALAAVTTTNFDDMYALVTAYDDAEKVNTAFETYRDALADSAIDITSLNRNAVKAMTTSNKDFSDLDAIYPTQVAGYQAWLNVRNKIVTAKATVTPNTVAAICSVLNTTTADANGLQGLLQLMRIATDNADLTYKELVLASGLPTTPNNPDEPGTNEPGTEEPGSEDPAAPGTGLVSTAEGNATTTVSIVAGLATALTALGAGVVAYRSARRSNK